MPARNTPCTDAKTRTRMAPEQGRAPAASTVKPASRQDKRTLPRAVGSTAWQKQPGACSSEAAAPTQTNRCDAALVADALANARRIDPAGAAGSQARVERITAIIEQGAKEARLSPQPHESRTLAPNQPGTEAGDPREADHLDEGGDVLHVLCRRVQQQRQRTDEHHRNGALQQRGQEGKHDAAPQRPLVGDHVGGEHGLAVSGARRMEHAVHEPDAHQPPQGHAVGPHRTHTKRELVLEPALLRQQPAGQAGGAAAALRDADPERVVGLCQGRTGAEQDGDRCDRGGTRPHGHAIIARGASLMPKSMPGDMLVKNASESFWLSVESSEAGFATLTEQPVGASTRVTGVLGS